jgi:hypothetical protein
MFTICVNAADIRRRDSKSFSSVLIFTSTAKDRCPAAARAQFNHHTPAAAKPATPSSSRACRFAQATAGVKGAAGTGRTAPLLALRAEHVMDRKKRVRISREPFL